MISEVSRLGPGVRRGGAMAQLAGSAAILGLQAVTPALAAPHSGVPKVRTGPELSDIALFVVAAIGVFLVRRALRKRFMKRPPKD